MILLIEGATGGGKGSQAAPTGSSGGASVFPILRSCGFIQL